MSRKEPSAAFVAGGANKPSAVEWKARAEAAAEEGGARRKAEVDTSRRSTMIGAGGDMAMARIGGGS